jgi:hypothetical protein
MAKLKYLVIHCTATPEGREVSAADIRRWHTSPAPGRVERLVANNEDANVDPWEITNGAAGYNSISRHIVYAGGCDAGMKPKDTRTAGQKEALRKYVLDFHARHPSVKIVGHNQLASKACPSFDVAAWLLEIGIKQ